MNRPEDLRERLLAQLQRDDSRFATYRKEVKAMLDKNERRLRMQKWYAGSIWAFVVLLGVALLYLGRTRPNPNGIWLGFTACFFVVVFSLELVKYFINRARIDVLKHVKELELHVLELKAQLPQRPS